MSEVMIRGPQALGPRVVAVEPTTEYELFLTFDNGEQRIFDAKPLLVYKAFEPLNNRGHFDSVKVAYGSIAWPGDIDYCPDTLYAQSRPV